MSEEKDIWPKRISVDKRIVKILSESTYDNFPNALREIIINSYDAKATKVNIEVNLKAEKIVIEDDGLGMSEPDFTFFIRIAGKTRQKDELISVKRKIVGQFGVGFLSIFPFFQNYHIETKKAGNPEILNANIPCYKYFSAEDQKLVDVNSIKITGNIENDLKRIHLHYTRITLNGFTKLTETFFHSTREQRPRKNSILEKDGLTRLKWRLEEDLPIKYDDERFNILFEEAFVGPPFEVLLNDDKLRRRVFGKEILEISKEGYKTFGKIRTKYFICTNRKVTIPIEARHFKVRNHNVGVGERTAFGLGEDVGGFRSKLNWLTGEVLIFDGMNDLIKVSRDGFNFSSDYEKLKDFFVERLSAISTKIEQENEINTIIRDKESTMIKNIKLLEPLSLKKKINELEKKTKEAYHSNNAVSIYENTLKDIELEDFNRKLIIENRRFNLILDNWNYKSDLYPAVKLEGDKILINKSYPFFSKKSQTDFFIKLHILLLTSLKDNNISEEAYRKFTKDILVFFSDYL